jgi:aminoglycoside phosphotransferase (APT) family kinase protein
VPGLGLPASRLLERLQKTYAGCPVSEPRPVHGALHASQWLEDGVGLALLDYDSLALGDPELDAATFLADMDVQNRERVPVDRLNIAFLAGYEETGGLLDPRLLAAYRANRRLEKALRVARALRPEGDAKAGRRLRGALACLGGSA